MPGLIIKCLAAETAKERVLPVMVQMYPVGHAGCCCDDAAGLPGSQRIAAAVHNVPSPALCRAQATSFLLCDNKAKLSLDDVMLGLCPLLDAQQIYRHAVALHWGNVVCSNRIPSLT
jgi:hypothetical protein